MSTSPRARPSRGRERSAARARQKRRGIVAVLAILIATGSVTVFAGSNVLCASSSNGVGLCTSTGPHADAARGGAPTPPTGGRSPSAPTTPSPPWFHGPSNRLDPLSSEDGSSYEGPSPTIPPPPHPPTSSLPLVFAPEAINASMLAELTGPLRPFLETGDTIMLSSGADSNETGANVNYLNSRLAALEPALPSGLVYEARTSGLANVASIVGGLSPQYRSIVYDYEPGYESEFSLNFTATLANFVAFAELSHLAGFQAVGYPYSLPLWGSNYQQYGWNYGTLLAATGANALQVQDQGAVHTAMGIWNRSITTLASQYGDYGIPTADISLQLTLASGNPNQINVSTAYAAYENAVTRGAGQIVLWWNQASLPQLLHFLKLVRG